MKTMNPRPPIQRGLTLIELVVAMAIAGIVMAAAYAVFLLQQKSYAVQDQVVEIQQNARVAMNLLARDLRMAGHGVPSSPVIIKGTPYTDALVIDGDGDGVTLLGCFGAPEGYLSKSAAIGATEIELVDSEQAEKFEVGDRGYVFIGEYDKAVIADVDGNKLTLKEGTKKRYPTTRLKKKADPGDTSVNVYDTDHIQVGDILTLGDERLYVTGIAGDTIDFDTDPTTPPSDPLQDKYKKNTLVNPIPVYRVQALRYYLDTEKWILRREDLSGGGGQPLADYIQDLNITQIDPRTCEVRLTARTDVPDDAGRFRGRTYRFTVRCRNP